MNHGSQEFRLHHHVNQLMSQLGASSAEGPGVYVDLLQRNMTPYISTQITAHRAKKKIAESSKTPVEFLQKYDELKSRNVRDLDSLTNLLSLIAEDEQHFGASLTPATSMIGQLPATGSKITSDELEKIKAELMKNTKQTSSAMSAETQSKSLKEKQSRNMNLPVQPDWLFQRPFLTMDFVEEKELFDPNVTPAGSLLIQQQESMVIDDLLCCMEGVEGQYIQAVSHSDRYSQKEFKVDESLDPALRELVRRILPISANYSLVVRFIEEKSAFEYGLNYTVLVAQLENQFRVGHLSLQKFWFYLQPMMSMMEILASIARSINKGECIGGAVLSLLHEKTSSLIGDNKGQELCLFLTQAACVPYFEILERWIYKGLIVDPYSEFLVEENSVVGKEKLQEDYNDSYPFGMHYTICRERVPVFLETVAQKILSTGKYLNVVRQCGRNVQCPNAEEMIYTIKERDYFEHIERAYTYASQLLLELLIKEKELMSRLRSVKHYFLLDHGDFIVQFMDMADEEMAKTMDEIMPQRLESLLELALRTSTANADPFKDDLKVDLLGYDLVTMLFKVLSIETKLEKDFHVDPTDLHLSGLEAFTFDYIVKWPVSLVLNRKSLIRYQMLFRHLFYCKHVERQLCNVWITNKSSKIFKLQSAYTSGYALRQRMLNFVLNFQYYMMVEVIEPNWVLFENNLQSVSTIDDVLANHSDFLNNCLKDCMLTDPELLRIVHKLMMVCVTFSNFIQLTKMSSLQGSVKGRKDDPLKKETATKVVQEHLDQIASSHKLEGTIATFDSNFRRLLVDLLNKIVERASGCDLKLLNILYRLDFNHFYDSQLESVSAERSTQESRAEHEQRKYQDHDAHDAR
ncbi:hypothetical protein CAPTEDRAFT_5306 [Capitella teleta]|uniref:Gamma-tubulin complex component n=1 Tax=Capitella teleta TaxID=283909 RepID=N1PB33_CAPTE|nr:hypothetical protein CAPTEDRAFT_5306 [Capitella teleta]|eukprot:ELU18812.1 hypothetical protein CAPTEDRAFT_5306 [Capitella teleta]